MVVKLCWGKQKYDSENVPKSSFNVVKYVVGSNPDLGMDVRSGYFVGIGAGSLSKQTR